MKFRGNIQSDYSHNVAGYVTDTGAANAYAVALDPAITAYTSGLTITFKAANANTTASTLAVNGLAAKTIKKSVSTDLSANDILANQIITVTYDGTNFQIQGGVGSSSSFDYPQILLTQIFS